MGEDPKMARARVKRRKRGVFLFFCFCCPFVVVVFVLLLLLLFLCRFVLFCFVLFCFACFFFVFFFGGGGWDGIELGRGKAECIFPLKVAEVSFFFQPSFFQEQDKRQAFILLGAQDGLRSGT